MPRDIGTPTLCFSFHCDCNGGSHQEGLTGNGVPGPPLQDLSAVVLGDHSSCRDPPLCCPPQAVFCLHGLGLLSLCLFLSCHHCTGFSTLPLPPPFSTSSHLPWPFPSPVNVDIASYCVSTCLRHRSGTTCSWPDLPAHLATRIRLHCQFAHSAMQTWFFCAELFIMVLSLGGLRPLNPLSRLPLV